MAQEEERKGSEVSFLHPFLVIQRPSKWERSPASGVPSTPARPLCSRVVASVLLRPSLTVVAVVLRLALA